MNKIFYALLLLMAGLASCDKDDVVPPLKEIAPVVTMNRSFDFIVRGTKRDTAYSNADKFNTGARLQEETTLGVKSNVFTIYFDAGPHVNSTSGDNIAFQIEKSVLKAGYVGIYNTGTQTSAPLKKLRYLYGTKDANGGFQAYILDNTMGSQLNGSLDITTYDAKHQTVSGTYQMSANLTFDPTVRKPGYHPEDATNVTVTGTFTNVKIRQD